MQDLIFGLFAVIFAVIFHYLYRWISRFPRGEFFVGVALFCFGIFLWNPRLPFLSGSAASRLVRGTVEIGSNPTEIEAIGVPTGSRLAIINVGVSPRAVDIPMSWTVQDGVEASGASSETGSRRVFGEVAPGMEIFGPATVEFGPLANAGDGAFALVTYKIEPDR